MSSALRIFYSDPQWMALSITQHFSGTLSIIGSSLIIYMILKGGKQKLGKIHNRLLLCLSTIDVLNSTSLGLSSIPFPKEFRSSNLVYNAFGSDKTCTAQGFFIAFGMATPIYNSCLCLYYMAVIKYNVKDDTLAKYEKYMHFCALTGPLSIAVYVVVLDLVRPSIKGFCWIDIDYDECESPFPLTSSSFDNADDENTQECKPRRKEFLDAATLTLMCSFGVVLVSIAFTMISTYLSVRKQTQAMNKYRSFQRRNSFVSDENKRGTKDETFYQCFMYVAAFFLTYVWLFIADLIPDKAPFPLIYLAGIFYPLQGFWNCIIYIRPRIMIVQEKEPDKSFIWILRTTIFGAEEEAVQQTSPSHLRTSIQARRRNSAQLTSSRLQILERSRMQSNNRTKRTRDDGNQNDEHDDNHDEEIEESLSSKESNESQIRNSMESKKNDAKLSSPLSSVKSRMSWHCHEHKQDDGISEESKCEIEAPEERFDRMESNAFFEGIIEMNH